MRLKEFIIQNKIRIIISFIIGIIMCSPVIVYNYLLYREKGITDIIFARFLGINPEIYQGLIGGAGQKFSINVFISEGIPFIFHTFLKFDFIISVLGVLGIILAFFSKNKLAKFLALFFLIPLLFLMGTQLLPTHFVIFMIPLCVFSSYLISKIESKKLLIIILSAIFIVNLYFLLPYISSKSAISQTRDFAIENIGSSDIVISDARIYRGRTVFMFNDKNYLESSYFGTLLNEMQNISTPLSITPIKIFYIECIPDDCGWGTIKDQPEFNKSIEEINEFLKSQFQEIKTINSGGMDMNNKISEPYFRIYQGSIYPKLAYYSFIESTHQWFFYPVRWKGERYDNYNTNNVLHKFAYLILWIEIIIASASIFFVIYELQQKFIK